MKEKSDHRNNWKKVLVGLFALVGGFLLSFVGFGVLWSGISWHYQLIMFFPFLLLSFTVSRWNKGAVGGCIFILAGVAPLGVLIAQFRDSNGSHLMPILVVLTWLIGIIAGYLLAKESPYPRPESSEDIALSKNH